MVEGKHRKHCPKCGAELAYKELGLGACYQCARNEYDKALEEHVRMGDDYNT